MELLREIGSQSHGALDVHGAELYFRRLLGKLPLAAYTCDADGLITYFNPPAERLWGRAPKLNDPVDRFCGSFRLFSPDGSLIPHDRCWMALALKDNREYNGHEIIIERPDGEKVTVLAHANSIHGDFGELLGAVNLLVNITDRKQAQEAQERLAAIVESSDDAIISKTLDGTIVSWNRGAEQIYGYAASEVIGQPISILLPPERADELPDILARLRRGERIDHFETRRRRRDGTIIDVSVTISPIETEGGAIIGASAVSRNISERKRLEEERAQLLAREQAARAEAENANHVKDQFLAMVSHELRTPVQAILGWARLLRTGQITEDAQVKALEVIERNARSQARLIQDLLDVSRMIAGKLRLDMRPVDLTSVIATAIDTVHFSAEAKDIHLQAHLDPDAGPVCGDADRLRQVVLNLLSNAIKFTPKGGAVQIRLDRIDADVEITVSDTGIGIEAGFLPHLFEPFRQAGGDSTTLQGGLGLGLAIVRHLVQLHGGSIRFHSAGKDQGSTFAVRIPIQPKA